MKQVPVEDHKRLGLIFKQLRLELMNASEKEYSTKKAQHGSHEAKALKALEKLRSQLDNILAKDHQMAFKSSVYYGEEQLNVFQ